MKKKHSKTKYKKSGKIFQKQKSENINDESQGVENYYDMENYHDDFPRTKIVTDKRKIDSAFADLYTLLDKQDFESEDDLAEFFERYNRGEFEDELKEIKKNQSPEKKAQSIIYKAFETDSKSKKIKLARQALKISDLCSDAYNILAEETDDYDEKVRFYKNGVEAGEKYLNIRNKDLPEGQMWSDFESRPYLRSLYGLSMTYRDNGNIEESVDIQEKLIKLNRNDNQGVRHILVFSLIALDRIDLAKELMIKYKKELSLEFLLAEYLLKSIEKGYSEITRAYFKKVFERNVFLFKYLFGLEKSQAESPESFEQGDENEAKIAAYNAIPAFNKNKKSYILFLLFAMEEYLKLKPENKQLKNIIKDLKKNYEEDEEYPVNMNLYKPDDTV